LVAKLKWNNQHQPKTAIGEEVIVFKREKETKKEGLNCVQVCMQRNQSLEGF